MSAPAGRTALALFALLSTGACARVLEYPDPAPEHDAEACRDGQDNDFDDRIDCEDPDCAGFCEEESTAECHDGIDNDGDGLTDLADPRCWFDAPPRVTRCAATAGVDVVENFDAPAWVAALGPWSRYGLAPDAQGASIDILDLVPHDRVLFDGRADGLIAFSASDFDPENIVQTGGSLVRERAFGGRLAGLGLSFGAALSEGAFLRVGIVPAGDAPALEAPRADAKALLAVTLDATEDPPTLALEVAGQTHSAPLSSLTCAGGAPCEEPLSRLELGIDADGVHARFTGADGAEANVTADLPDIRSMSASKLVLWGGSSERGHFALVDDLRLHVEPDWPCGFPVPQITEDACAAQPSASALGQSLTVTRDRDGRFCALVTESTDASSPPSSIGAWRSEEGDHFSRVSPLGTSAVELPTDTVLVGAGIAADADGLHAAVAYRRGESVEVAFSDAQSCGEFGPLSPGTPLFADAEPPSYVLAGARHDVFFTRPPTDETKRTLWRLARGASSPELLAELPSDAGAPVSVSRIGGVDLVLAYPLSAGGSPGAGVLVSDATLHTWSPVGSSSLLTLPGALKSQEGRVTFDDRGLRSVAVAWGSDHGFLLYTGESAAGVGWVGSETRLSVGSALLTASGQVVPDSAAAPPSSCGNGSCEAGEGSSCPADCDGAGTLVLVTPLDGPSDFRRMSTAQAPGATAYMSPVAPEFVFAGGPSTWSAFPLERALDADFELSFDVFLDVFANDGNLSEEGHGLACTAYVGLGTAPPAGLVPAEDGPVITGLFSRLSLSRRCPNTFFVAPFVRAADAAYALDTPDDGEDCRDERLFSPGWWQHVVLRREGNTLMTRVSIPDGCGAVEQMLPYSGALGALPAVLIGFGGRAFESCAYAAGTGTIEHLELRLLDDPDACSPPRQRCANARAEPSCVDLNVDAEHCGACGHACGENEICQSGACVCGTTPGIEACGGKCVDTLGSADDCGGCGVHCDEFCYRGVCDLAFGGCARPFELPAEGGDFPIDFTREAPRLVPIDCDVVTGLDSVSRSTSVTVSNLVVATWTPDKSGSARVAAEAGQTEVVSVVLGLSDTASGVECGRWLSCDVDGSKAKHGASLTADVIGGTTYRIGVGLISDTPRDLTLEVGVEP